MKIYEFEKQDGLESLIKTTNSVALSCVTKPSLKKSNEVDLKVYSSKANANPDQFDLYYLDSILVSTGWNLNDDVFDAEEMWSSKATPVDKAFNYMHDESDIIGHITSSSILVEDKEYTEDDIPEEFHIAVGSVLYRVWSDDKLRERMDTLISEIEEGKWFVSMECLFANFDYAVVDKDGNESIIKRNKTTAFLSKYLRSYGGKGEYEGKKIGRLLRKITFSGKGLVNEPANPNSVILNHESITEKLNTKSFKGSVASKQQENKMNEAEILKAQAADLQKQVDELKATNKALDADIRAKAEAEHKTQIDGLNASVTESKAALDKVVAESVEKDKAISDSKEALAALQAKFDETTKEIETLKASMKKADRINQMAQAGVPADKHEDLITKFANVDDAIFSEFVELHASKKVVEAPVVTETVAEVVEDAKAAVKDATDALDTAKASAEGVTTPTETDTTQDVRKAVGNWLKNNVFTASANKNIRQKNQAK